jgi:hypothetical protein
MSYGLGNSSLHIVKMSHIGDNQQHLGLGVVFATLLNYLLQTRLATSTQGHAVTVTNVLLR